jgi:hypothetical protein
MRCAIPSEGAPMLVRPEWYDPDWEPPAKKRRSPGPVLRALFWTCILLGLLAQLLLF